jgi:pimeloyl-ACP methyl ester carboxylesterase
MPYVDLPGVHLWYDDSGGPGVPVVFMHAASGTSESWVQQLPAFTSVGYRCVTYDRRDWGRSRPDPFGEQPGCAGDDLRGLVDHLHLDRFHLVATAAGAPGALDFTLSHPERVRALVLADCTGGLQDADALDFQQRIRPPEIEALPVELREVGASYRGANPEGLRRWLQIERSTRPEGCTSRRQAPRNRLDGAHIAALRLPVLLLAGEADLITPPAYMRLLADRIPGSRLASVPEAGHAAFWEQPEVWNRLVLDFLARC